MALTAQVKTFPLFGGIDTKTDEKYVASDNLLTAENVRFFGVQSAQKRYGQAQLTQQVGVTGTQITAGKSIGAFNNELLAFDGSALYTYAQAQNVWINRGALTETVLTTTPVIRSAGSVSGLVTALVNSVEVYAWEDSRGGVYYAIRDPQSGAFTIAPTQLNSTAFAPQIIVTSSWVYIFYGVGSTIWQVTLSAANPSNGIISQSMIGSTGTSGVPFAVSYNALANWPITTCWQTSGGSTFQVQAYTANLVLITSTTFTYASPSAVLSMALTNSTDGVNTLVSVLSLTALKFVTINNSSGATDTSTTAITLTAGSRVGAVPTGTSTIQVYYDDRPASSLVKTQSRTITFSAVLVITVGATATLQGVQLASQPVLSGTMPYFITCSPTTNIAGATSQQTSFFLTFGISTLTLSQRFFGESAFLGGTVIPTLTTASDGSLFVGLAQRTLLQANSTSTVYSQTGITACYFAFPTASQVVIRPYNSTCLINCGNVYSYDGTNLVESGFWEFPDGVTATATATGSLNSGLYYYVLVYEWTDAAGNVHYSAGSYPVGITLATTNLGVQLTVPYTALTRKSDVVIGVYRTATNPLGTALTPDTGTGLFYRVGQVSNVTTGTASTTYTDTASDAAVVGNLYLYAPPDGSGEVDNEPPPPFSHMVATKTRIFGVAQDDPTALWYSKPLAPGRPAEFSSLFVQRIETVGGRATALGAMDTQVVLFKGQRIEYLPGDGPNSAGIGLFPPLQLVSSTSGCTSAPSVLTTSDGLYYQSQVGLCLLDRSLSVNTTLGLPVQGLLVGTSALTLSGAQAVTAQNQLRWTSTAGTALVLDYVTNRWSTYTNYDAVSYAFWQNKGVRLRTNGEVWYEDTTSYLDGTAVITMTIETAWLKPANFAQGFAALWYAELLGDYQSSHNLVVEVANDYLDTPLQTVTWNATSYGNLGAYGSGATYGSDPVFGANVTPYTAPYQLRIALSRQVCESVKFTVYDSGQSGQSCILNEIALQYGVIGGLNRVPSYQQG